MMKTSWPRTFSLIFTKVSPSGKLVTAASPRGSPIDLQISSARGRLELPEKIFSRDSLIRRILRTVGPGESSNAAQFSVDKAPVLWPPLGNHGPARSQACHPLSLLVDAVLVVAFFIYIYSVVSTHVPSSDPKMIVVWGAYTASCLTAVFWLALQMFRVTYRAQRDARKNK